MNAGCQAERREISVAYDSEPQSAYGYRSGPVRLAGRRDTWEIIAKLANEPSGEPLLSFLGPLIAPSALTFRTFATPVEQGMLTP